MREQFKKPLLAGIAIALLMGAAQVQRSLNHEREELGLTRYTELKGAPPVLALTTVALGGFRGLISNALWIRATELQEDDKYFEMVQLADWITKLEPHFTQVWLNQSWNMAYNISVKFKDPADRWRWVQRGIELLRDQGLKYNPHDVLIHRELAWFFQHKMGANLDDAHLYYKQMWANQMSKIFDAGRPNWDELIHPTTADATNRAALLRDKYKMDPVFMKQVDETYGPLEWRLPEASAIYWGAEGLEDAKLNERAVNPDELITLRRIIYQSLMLSFQRGRLISDKPDRLFEFAPNLDIIPKVSDAYEQAMQEDAKNRDHIQTAHRNFLRDAVYFLYVENRVADAAYWFKYLCDKYPDKRLLSLTLENSMPGQISLEDYCIGRIQDELNSPGEVNARAIIEGLERTAFTSYAEDDDDRFLGYEGLARKAMAKYKDKIKAVKGDRLALPPLPVIQKEVVQSLLEHELSPALAAHLATKLNVQMPPRADTSTNAPDVDNPVNPLSIATPANAPPADGGGK